MKSEKKILDQFLSAVQWDIERYNIEILKVLEIWKLGIDRYLVFQKLKVECSLPNIDFFKKKENENKS